MDYKVTDTELTSIADAIRTKGGTSEPLTFPSEFVSAIGSISTGGGGTITVLTLPNAKVTATLDEDTYTEYADANGECVIAVSNAGTYSVMAYDENDTFIGSSTVAVKLNYYTSIGYENITFADATPLELQGILSAHYNDSLDITTLWNVGDTRDIVINGESHQLVLMNKGGKTLTTPINGHTECAFIVGLKNCMSTTLSPDGLQNTASWSTQNSIRPYCNGTFKGYIDSILPDVFKQFVTVTGRCNQNATGNSNETVDDYFCLPAEKEVFGSRSDSTATEANALSQFEWYTTEANRIKTCNGSACSWYERSPYYLYIDGLCCVTTSGSPYHSGRSVSLGVSPFGCL